MEQQFRNRLIEILIDRGLIGLLIVLFGWQVSSSLERYKLVEAERVADSSQFVAACSEMWAKAYEFERHVNQAMELKARAWLLSALRKDGQMLRVEIAERDSLAASSLATFSEALATRRYILGEPMTAHFDSYVGLVRARAQAESEVRADIGDHSQKISRDAIEAFDKQLASMRFSATAAREHAISVIP